MPFRCAAYLLRWKPDFFKSSGESRSEAWSFGPWFILYIYVFLLCDEVMLYLWCAERPLSSSSVSNASRYCESTHRTIGILANRVIGSDGAAIKVGVEEGVEKA
jgi:hypothetical protein